MKKSVLLVILPLLCDGLAGGDNDVPCDHAVQDKYCNAWYGGDYHTGCQYCGRGHSCPPGLVTGRKIEDNNIRDEILSRHNKYRRSVQTGQMGMPPTKEGCLPPLRWDDELAQVAQVWADQCAMILYPDNNNRRYPKIFHEKSIQRTTSQFGHPPGVGQNVAWALTEHVNFTQIIDDLWYRDIRRLTPGIVDNFTVTSDNIGSDPGSALVTQMLWGQTTHIGCGWLQIDVGPDTDNWSHVAGFPGRYENFFVCNYGVGGNVAGEPLYRHPDCQYDTSTQHPVVKNKHETIFSDFSADSRAVIGSCLQTIQCLQSPEVSDRCEDLFRICISQGPGSLSETSVTMSRHTVECRIENILCYVTTPQSQENMCQHDFSTCLDMDPHDVSNDEHQNNFNSTMDILLKMPELGPLIEQGVTSVYNNDLNTEEDDMGVSTVSLVTSSTPATISPTSAMVTSSNIDTLVTTTKLNIGDISVTTLSPLKTSSNVQAADDYSKYVETTTTKDDHADTDDATNVKDNLINDYDETDSISFQSNSVATNPQSSDGTGGSDIKQSSDNDFTTHSTDQANAQSEIEGKDATEEENEIKLETFVPVVDVNDLIPELQDQVFSTLNISGIIPDFNLGDSSADITNDTLVIFQDILVGPDGNINVSLSSNLNGLFDTNLENDISHSTVTDKAIQASITTTSSMPTEDIEISTDTDDIKLDQNVESLLWSDTIDLDTISDDVLRQIIKINIPGIEESMQENMLGILKSHGGTLHISMLNNILRNMNIPSNTDNSGSEDIEDKTLLSPTITEITTDASEIDGVTKSLSSNKNPIDVNSSTTTVFTPENHAQNTELGSNTTPSIIQEKIEKPDANLDAVVEKGNSDDKESDNIGETSDSVKPEDMITVTEPGHHSSFPPHNSQTLNLSGEPAAESRTMTVSGTSTNNLDDDSHQLFSRTEDNLTTVELPETTLVEIHTDASVSFTSGDKKNEDMTTQSPEIITDQITVSDKVTTISSMIEFENVPVTQTQSTVNKMSTANVEFDSNLPVTEEQIDVKTITPFQDTKSENDENIESGSQESIQGNTIASSTNSDDENENGSQTTIAYEDNKNDNFEVTTTLKPSLESKNSDDSVMINSIVDVKTSNPIQEDIFSQSTITSKPYISTLSNIDEVMSSSFGNEQATTVDSLDNSQVAANGLDIFNSQKSYDVVSSTGKFTDTIFTLSSTESLTTEPISTILNDESFFETLTTTEITENAAGTAVFQTKSDDAEGKDQDSTNSFSMTNTNIEFSTENNKQTQTLSSRKVDNDLNVQFGQDPPPDQNNGEECYRRYINRTRKPDISYYNTTVRTRLLTAICLEGISCQQEEDSTRCKILHRKCNEHVDTTNLTFSMRVTLSECTVEDILCHLGHRTPVMCCQDKYSECVHNLATHSQSIQRDKQTELSGTESDMVTLQQSHTNDQDNQVFVLESINGTLPQGLDQGSIVNQIANQLFNNGNPILSSVNGFNESSPDINNLFNVDNDTLPIFQDFLVILDDSKDFNQTLQSGDVTVSSILNNLNLNSSDFKIVFDPDSTVIGLGDNISLDENVILSEIKNQVNNAVNDVAQVCSNNICIKNIDSSQISVLNKTSEDNKTNLIMLSPKEDKKLQLDQCVKAQQCVDPVPCMFAHSRCLQLSNIDILPHNTLQDMTQCKVESLMCLLESETMQQQEQCVKEFKRCTSMLGVDIYGGSIVNFVHHETEPGNEKIQDQIESEDKSVSTTVVSDISETLTDNEMTQISAFKDYNESQESEISQLETTTVSDNTDYSSQESIDDTAINHTESAFEDMFQNKLNETGAKPEKINVQQNQTDRFQMNLPGLDLSISVKEDSDLNNSTFGMSLPTFGFNITVDKDSSQCSIGTRIFNDFDEIPTGDPCELCSCIAGEIKCFTQECQKSDENCKQLPRKENICCPEYDCSDTENQLGRADVPTVNSEDTLDMLSKVKDSLISVFNDALEIIQEDYITTTTENLVVVKNYEDSVFLNESATSEASTDFVEITDTITEKGVDSATTFTTNKNVSKIDQIEKSSTTELVPLEVLNDELQTSTFPNIWSKNNDSDREEMGLIENKNVKVFLNFTWPHDNINDDLINKEFAENVTDKIRNVIDSGVGYIIVPDGEEPEDVDDNSVHLVQTINFDKNGNIDIETSIADSENFKLTELDKEFIMKVENKTLQVTEDIFNEMQNKLSVTTTENLISTNVFNENEVKSDTTQLSSTNKNEVDNKFTTESFTVGNLPDKKIPILVNSDIAAMKHTPNIYISLISEQTSIKQRLGENHLDDIQTFASEIEKETGYSTIIIDSDDKLPENETIFLVHGDVEDDGRLNLMVYKDKVPLDMLGEDDKEEAMQIKEIIQSKFLEYLAPSLSNKVKPIDESPDVLLDKTPSDILEAVSKVMGFTILNHTALMDNDTILIFEDILVNSENYPNLSHIIKSESISNNDQLPNELKNLILSALNQSNIIPLEDEFELGPSTTPKPLLKVSNESVVSSNPIPETTPISPESNNIDPLIIVSVKSVNDTASASLAEKIQNRTGISTLLAESSEEQQTLDLLKNHDRSFYIEVKEDQERLSANILYNLQPVDEVQNFEPAETEILDTILDLLSNSTIETKSSENVKSTQTDSSILNLQKDIINNIANLPSITLLNSTDPIDLSNGNNDTLVLFQDILIDSNGNFTVTSNSDNYLFNSSNLPESINDAVVQAIKDSEEKTTTMISVNTEISEKSGEGTVTTTSLDKISVVSADTNVSEHEDQIVGIKFEFDQEDTEGLATSTEVLSKLEVGIILPFALYNKTIDNKFKIIPAILKQLMISDINVSSVKINPANSEFSISEDLDSVTINYENCSVIFNNEDLKYLPSSLVEKVLVIFEGVDLIMKDFVPDIFSFKSCLSMVGEEEGNMDSFDSILVSIKFEDKPDKKYIEQLKADLELVTNKDVKVIVNENPIVLDTFISDNKTVVIEVSDSDVNGYNIVETKVVPKLSHGLKKKVENIIESTLGEFVNNLESIIVEDGRGEENHNKSLVVISMICNDCQKTSEYIENLVDSLTIESGANVIILTNSRARDIEKLFDEDRGRNKYLLVLPLVKNGITVASIFDSESNPLQYDSANDFEQVIFKTLKDGLDEAYGTVITFSSDTTIIPSTSATTIPNSIKPTDRPETRDKIVNILADLLIKTLHLSFKIKGAIDRNSLKKENIEFDIISRKDKLDRQNASSSEIPDIIKITPDDAMFIHDSKISVNNADKSIIIDLTEDQTINFNVPNGEVYEIDLSNLPAEKDLRDNEIRTRVKSFIETLDIDANKDDKSNSRSSLSEDIIKNITKIVLNQMDEAILDNQNKPRTTLSDFIVPFRTTSSPATFTSLPPSALPSTLSTSTRTTPSSVSTGSENGIQLEQLNDEVSSTSLTPTSEIQSVELSTSKLSSLTSTFPNSALTTVMTSTSSIYSTKKTNFIHESLPTILEEEKTTLKPDNFENESIQVINEVKNTISNVIKEVISQEHNNNSNIDNLVQKIRDNVPDDVKIKTSIVENDELQSRIKETVGKILTDEEITSIVQLRNISNVNGKSITSQTNVILPNVGIKNYSAVTNISNKDTLPILSETTTSQNELTSPLTKTREIIEESNLQDLNEDYEDDRLVINLKEFPNEEINEIEGDLDATVNPLSNEQFYPPTDVETNDALNIIQDGNLYAESFNTGVIKAKVVEDTSYARSIRPSNVGVAAIISIVIGILAAICFAIMILLAMRRRRSHATAEIAPSSSAYTNTSRYSPDNSSSGMSDMKATYVEELSPNVSTSDIHPQEVVVPMDGHLTIVGSYEEFLDVPTGARPNLLQGLPVSPTMHAETVTKTIEMNDPELAFTPSYRNHS